MRANRPRAEPAPAPSEIPAPAIAINYLISNHLGLDLGRVRRLPSLLRPAGGRYVAGMSGNVGECRGLPEAAPFPHCFISKTSRQSPCEAESADDILWRD